MFSVLDELCVLALLSRSASELICSVNSHAGSFASHERELAFDPSPIEKNRAPASTARGDWGRGGGGCRLARVHEAGKPQWILWNVVASTSTSGMSIRPWSNKAWHSHDTCVATRVQMHVCEAF